MKSPEQLREKMLDKLNKDNHKCLKWEFPGWAVVTIFILAILICIFGK